MNIYRTSSMLKTLARGQLLGNYKTVVGALLTYWIIRGVLESASSILTDTNTFFGIIISYIVLFIISLIMGVFSAGQAYLYLRLICNQSIRASDIFHGFRHDTDKILMIQLCFSTIYYVSMLPGTICRHLFLYTGQQSFQTAYWALTALAYVIYLFVFLILSQSFYLLLDFPEYSAREVIQTSCQIMKGQKGRLFHIYISFIPFILLGFLSLGLSFLWIMPYMNATFANFYIDLIQKRNHDPALGN